MVLASAPAGPPAVAGDPHAPANAVAGLDAAPGLAATLFACEPMLVSPTNIDVDHRGRVWVCEVVNYRARNGDRPAGDRILILEDTDGDGRADKSTVFYQGRDIDSAMGICVLGNRVIVSVSPNIFVFTDVDGDGKADKKELLFSKTGNPQHDHSAHKFVFGPDGRLYWNFGNQGKAVHDRNGKPVADLFGRTVNDAGKPYRGGMAFRCDLDGGNFEVLAHNFRNNYELAVDSFGGLWQSDNDDDGNRSVRINFLLEYGNYGYEDELTGAGWRVPRTNLEREIPNQHWHQNDPGVVPNLLVTGAGSPTGIVVYEGDMLPPKFRGQLIHCDAGPNVVRSYPVSPDGAGFRTSLSAIINVLKGTRDDWFRPSDACVAPDGSLFVADWYDPGVGGHRMRDIDRGRIYRIAPPRSKYQVPRCDLATIAGAVSALQSPNLATRYLAWTTLSSRIREAEPALAALFKQSPNARMRARALWLLGACTRERQRYVDRAAADPDSNIRMTALRLARMLRTNLRPTIEQLAHDASPGVRRECAIALRNLDKPQRASLWAELAAQYIPGDRWSLEALGIGAEGDWDACLAAWLTKTGASWNSPAGRDLVWRSRAAETAGLLEKIIEDPSTAVADLPRYLRAFDFLEGSRREDVLARLAFSGSRPDAGRKLIAEEALTRLDARVVVGDPARRVALIRTVESSRKTPRFVGLVERFELVQYAPELLSLAQKSPQSDQGVRAIRAVLKFGAAPLIQAALNGTDAMRTENTIRALGISQDARGAAYLLAIVNDPKRSMDMRRLAVAGAARTRTGAFALLDAAAQGKLDPVLRQTASAELHTSRLDEVRKRVDRVFPLPPSIDAKPLPPIPILTRRPGDAEKGRLVFSTIGTCNKCHVVNKDGKDVGPNLSEIGDKLSRAALYESILFPSAGISHNFATFTVTLQSGEPVSGILVSRTADEISIKTSDAITRTFRMSEVEDVKEQAVSLMPADLQKAMSATDLINLVEYLTTLRKPGSKGRPGANALLRRGG